jgi:hypothetical protein
MGNLIVAPPREIGRDPIHTLARWRQEAPNLPNMDVLHERIVLVSLAKSWAGKFGAKEADVMRSALAARLTLERRLGEFLAKLVRRGRPKEKVIPDDLLPEWLTKNASSAAQTLAATPKHWLDKVVEDVLSGDRRLNVKEIYLEAKRIVAGMAAEEIPREAEGIILGDFREAGRDIPDESVALVFTDPPYDRASLELYGEAARLAKRVLLPGGSMLAYAPNYALPDVFASCREHLTY